MLSAVESLLFGNTEVDVEFPLRIFNRLPPAYSDKLTYFLTYTCEKSKGQENKGKKNPQNMDNSILQLQVASVYPGTLVGCPEEILVNIRQHVFFWGGGRRYTILTSSKHVQNSSRLSILQSVC